MTDKPRTLHSLTICRDCFQAWPTENLRDGNDKPCDCGDYLFEVIELEPVLDRMETIRDALIWMWEDGKPQFFNPQQASLYDHLTDLLREHGRPKDG